MKWLAPRLFYLGIVVKLLLLI